MKFDQGSNGLEAMQQWFSSMRTVKGMDWASYWSNQDRILDSMQEFSRGWFERRHQAAQSAIDAAHRTAEAKSPVDAARECQGWLMGSIQRIAADCLACQKHMMAVAELSSPPPSGVVEPSAGPAKGARLRAEAA